MRVGDVIQEEPGGIVLCFVFFFFFSPLVVTRPGGRKGSTLFSALCDISYQVYFVADRYKQPHRLPCARGSPWFPPVGAMRSAVGKQ